MPKPDVLRSFWAKFIALTLLTVVTTSPVISTPTIEILSQPLRLKFSGIEEPQILQRSSDLNNWEDIFLVDSLLNDVELRYPIPEDFDKGFYRLRSLSAPLIIKMNTFPGSDLLATIVSGSEIEIKIFGARDVEGIPETITGVSYRVGKYLYIGSEEAAYQGSSNTKTVGASIIKKTLNQFETRLGTTSEDVNEAYSVDFMSGYVVVDGGGHCLLPGIKPIVEYRSVGTDANGAAMEYSGFVDMQPVPGPLNPTQAVYRYRVPYWFSMPPDNADDPFSAPGIPERMLNGLRAYAESTVYKYTDPLKNSVEIATDVVFIAAVAFGGGEAYLVYLTADIIRTAVSRLVAANRAIYATLDDTPTDHLLPLGPGPVVASTTHLRAVLPKGNGGYDKATAWVQENLPSSAREGPTLVIDITCIGSGGLAILQIDSSGTYGRYFGPELSPVIGASWGELRGGPGVPLAWAIPTVIGGGTYGRIRTQAHLDYNEENQPELVADSLNIEWLSYSSPMRNGDRINFSPAISGYPTFSPSWSYKDDLEPRGEGVPKLRIRFVADPDVEPK